MTVDPAVEARPGSAGEGPGPSVADGATPTTSSRMTAHAVVEVDRNRGVSRIPRLRSDGPFRLRPSGPTSFEPFVRGARTAARVSIAAATAGPLGGDHLRVDVTVGDGATLVLNEISATLVLPGVHGDPSSLDYRIRVGDGATLIWLSEPIIAAAGCDHVHRITVDLGTSSRLFLRDDLIAGRTGEPSGDLALGMRVRRAGRPLLDQRLVVGDGRPGWDGPAVLDGARAVGNLVVVDPGTSIGSGRSDLIGDRGVSFGIADDVVAATASAPDSLALGRGLDTALSLVGSPWAPDRPSGPVSANRRATSENHR